MRVWGFNSLRRRGVSGIIVSNLVGRRVRPSSIIRFFRDGTDGFWLNGHINQNHYQEDTGQTEAGDTDTLGLIFSQAQGGVGNLSSELVSNSDFATNDLTDWETFGNAQSVGVTNEIATYTRQSSEPSAATGIRQQTNTYQGNRGYRASARVRLVSGDEARWILPGQGTTTFRISTPNGFQEFSSNFLAGGDAPAQVRSQTSSASVVEIDYMRAREIPGWHFQQGTPANLPTREQDSDGNWFYRLDGTDDFEEAPAAHFEPPFTLAGVFSVDGTDADQTFMSGTDAGSNSAQLYYAHSAGAIGIYNGSTPVLEVTVGQQPISPVVVVAVVDGANSELYVGDTIETGTLGTRVVDLGTFRLGRRQFDASQYHHGRVYQPFGINRRLSSDEIENIKSELRRLSPANP